MKATTHLVKSKAPLSHRPNQNYVKLKLSCANITWLDIARKETIVPSLTVINNWKLPQNTKSACMVRDTASLGPPVDSYTRMKWKNCQKHHQLKCKKCNHKPNLFQRYTTLLVHHHSLATPMTTPRVSRTSTLTQTLMLASLQKTVRILTRASVISWVLILWEYGVTLSHIMNTHGLKLKKYEHKTIV